MVLLSVHIIAFFGYLFFEDIRSSQEADFAINCLHEREGIRKTDLCPAPAPTPALQRMV
jgi:hypothetical protein